MKLLHVISGYLPQDSGGTQMHLRDLAQEQRELGHEVLIFTRLAGDEHDEFELSRGEWEGIPVIWITNNFKDVDRFSLLWTHPRIDERFREVLEGEEPDLVHFHHLTCLSTSMVRVSKEKGLPVVLTLHDYWLVCPRGQRIHPEDLSICETLDRERCLSCLHGLWPHLLPLHRPRRLLDRLTGRDSKPLRPWETHIRRMLDLCDATIAPSSFHRERFVEWGLDPARCHVVRHGIPREGLLAPPRGRKEIQNLGFIGTVIPSKGVHVLLDAFVLLDRRDLNLHIHGEAPGFHGETSYLDRMREGIPPGLEVRFHGRYENRDLPRILDGLDLLVIPSLWWETFCLTAREGALAGLPVIGSRLGGIAEAVDQGLALGFEPGNPADLARVIRRLLEDEELRDEMSRKAGLVRDMQSCLAETLEVYAKAGGEER